MYVCNNSDALMLRDVLTIWLHPIVEGLAKTNTELENPRGVKAEYNDICCMREWSYELGTVTETSIHA